MRSEFERHVLERLGRVVPLRTRAMFGGLGIYSSDVFFALVARDVLYFKVDARNRADYEARGASAFQPFADRPSKLAYFELPGDVLDDARELPRWIAAALAAARDKPRQRARGRAAPARVEELPGIGPAARRRLAEVGVTSLADLEARGSVAAFLAVARRGPPPRLELLYALECALLRVPRDRLPEAVQRDLRRRAGRA